MIENIGRVISYIAKQQGVDNIDFGTDVKLRDDGDGSGPYIKEWNLTAIPQPSMLALLDAEIYIKNEIESDAYIEIRKNAYPKIEDQLDMMYWDQMNGTTVWKDTISNIKSLYPKT